MVTYPEQIKGFLEAISASLDVLFVGVVVEYSPPQRGLFSILFDALMDKLHFSMWGLGTNSF